MVGGYIVKKSPNNILNKRDFDKTKLYSMRGDNSNRFCLRYDSESIISHYDGFPIYEINVTEWDILYPIRRASFRRYYASKKYLTIYDYNWCEFVKRLFLQ